MTPLVFLAACSFVAAGPPAGGAVPVVEMEPVRALDRYDDSDANIALAFSPDGKKLAAGGTPHSLKLWGLPGCSLLRNYALEEEWDVPCVRALAIAPKGGLLAVGGHDEDHFISLVSLRTHKAQATLKGHTDFIFAVAFAPDGQTLASCGRDQTVRLWDVRSNKERLTLTGHRTSVTALVFSPDGKTLVSGGDQVICTWNPATGKMIHTFTGHSHYITSLAVSLDNRFLASASWTAEAKIWDLARGKEVKTVQGRFAVFVPDGKHLLTVMPYEMIYVWDAASGTKKRAIKSRFTPRAVALSPTGRFLAVACDDGKVRLWEVASLLNPPPTK